MDKKNTTYLAFGGHVELQSYRYIYFAIMFTVYVLIICSNFTIPMYILIAALLLNSVLFSTNIYPKLLIDFLIRKTDHIIFSLPLSEFLLLSAMSYDRYVSICKPLQYPTIMRKSILNVFLVFAWFVPACQTAVPIALNANNKLCRYVLEGIFCNNSANHLYCETSRALSIYGLVVLLNLALFPMIFVLFTYAKILIISYQRCGAFRKKAAQTCLPHLLVLINYSCLITYDIIIVRLESDFHKTARFVMTLQIITYNPLFNPIIYGLKMKEISKHLKRLFCQLKVK
ncbi:hypothetical protein Q5P01_014148 [Channa striata]|uniref:G-protein coupled receptors family 1 profile domain-containing protein n=1 Tax=Channa striata TaxID=64152 RepID=A0AA88MLD7_CHASR|nr:hypothetical protein Q5P01_014148 [Channa striata]